MRPDEYLDSKTINRLYGDQRHADCDPAEGLIVAASIGILLWLAICAIWKVIDRLVREVVEAEERHGEWR